MLSPVTKEIEGFSVTFRPLPATEAFTLAKRVGVMLLPLLKSLDLTDLKAEVNLDSLMSGLADVLSELPDDKAVAIVVDSLKGSTIVAPNQPAVEILGRSDVDKIFCGELDAMFAIVFEAWKYQKLAPFRLAARYGSLLKLTGISSEAAGTPNKPGPALAG